METLIETLIPNTSLPKMLKLKDLIYYEGPLLSHFESTYKEQFLFYWVDSDENYNRWLVFRTSDDLLEKYLSKSISLLDLILDPDNGNVYKVDIDDKLNQNNLSIVELKNIPQDYLPSQESFYNFKSVSSDAELTYISENENSGVLQAYYNDSNKIGKGIIDLELLANSLNDFSEINKGLRRVFINHERAKFQSTVPKRSRKPEHKFDELSYVNATKFNYFGNTSGSFGALFKTKAANSSSEIEQKYIEFLMQFFESSNSHEDFLSFINGLEKSVIESFKSLLWKIKDAQIQFNLNYINSKTDFRVSEKINPDKAGQILTRIQAINHNDSIDKTVTGRFTALNLDTGSYKFQVLNEKGEIMETSQGHLDSDRREMAFKIKWDKSYRVIITRKSSMRIGSKKMHISDTLVSFTEI